ncbi:hypothetical protein IWW45_002040 [Coemansia sp. RSA 485]|nr:hypothetical protein IWW45_002040 [Coemansia sp. RSA 485]
MLSRTSTIQQQARTALGHLLFSRSFSCSQKTLLSRHALARPRISGLPEIYQGRRNISIKTGSDAEPQEQRARKPDQRIQRPTAPSQLRDLANDVVAAFERTESAVLRRWADRLRTVSTSSRAHKRIGVLYSDTAGISAVDAAKTQAFSSMTIAEADNNSEAFADWLFSCDRVVVLAGRQNIVKALALSGPSVAALRLHPDTTILVDGVEGGSSAAEAFSGLLLESLQLLGVVSAKTDSRSCSVLPGSGSELLQSQISAQKTPDDAAHARLLACAVEAAMLSAEHGGQSALPSFAGFMPFSDKHDTAQTALQQRNVACSVAEASKRMQHDFENGDLATIDASIGDIKQKTSRWFSSGKIWQTLLLRVYEAADDLIDNAILDRCYETAELGMIHAAGRLNESIRRVAADLAASIDAYARQASAAELVDPAAVSSTVGTLRAIACQTDSVDQFALARQVWDARRLMAESDVLEGIPRHIHWSLAQFWAIQATALSGAATGFVYFDLPFLYAGSGGLGLSLLAFVWLGRRWNLLERVVLGHLDSQADRLREKTIGVHKDIIQAKLEAPVLSCIQASPSAFAQRSTDMNSIVVDSTTLSQWRQQLGSAQKTFTVGAFVTQGIASTPALLRQPLHRKLRLSAYWNQKAADLELARKLRETFGGDPVLVMGNWPAGMVRYHEPIRGKGWRRVLKQHGFQVYLIDEFQSSSICPVCNHGLETFRYVRNLRSWQLDNNPWAKCHGLLRC